MHGGYKEFLSTKVQNFAHSERSVGQILVNTAVNKHEGLINFLETNKNLYNIKDLDPSLPNVIYEFTKEMPILLHPRVSA